MITWTIRWCKENGGYTLVDGIQANESDIFGIHQISCVFVVCKALNIRLTPVIKAGVFLCWENL